MKHAWPPRHLALGYPCPDTTDVLLSSDVPELVFAFGSDKQWLGVLAEHDIEQGRSRWVYAPITKFQKEAILGGAIALYDCFRKPEVLLVDVEEDGRTSVGLTDGHEIPDEALPRAGFLLPAWARPASYRSVVAARTAKLSLAGKNSHEGMPLRVLAKLADAFQGLVIAIGLAWVYGKKSLGPTPPDGVERFGLYATAAAPGSLEITLSPQSPSDFAKSSTLFEEIAAAKDDQLAVLIQDMGPRVRGRYTEFLELLEKHETEFLFERDGGRRVYVSPQQATKALLSIPDLQRTITQKATARGCFLGFDVKDKKFSFYDEDATEVIQGQLSEGLKAPDEISVGFGSPYRAIHYTIETLHSPARRTRRYVLQVISDPIVERSDADAGAAALAAATAAMAAAFAASGANEPNEKKTR